VATELLKISRNAFQKNVYILCAIVLFLSSNFFFVHLFVSHTISFVSLLFVFLIYIELPFLEDVRGEHNLPVCSYILGNEGNGEISRRMDGQKNTRKCRQTDIQTERWRTEAKRWREATRKKKKEGDEQKLINKRERERGRKEIRLLLKGRWM
jgi:hypothetical protein